MVFVFLTSLSMISVKSIHVAENGIILFCLWLSSILLCVCVCVCVCVYTHIYTMPSLSTLILMDI